MGRHSAPSTKASGSLFSALTAKKKAGRHAPTRSENTAGGVLAAVDTCPVPSAFIVPTAATAAVVASSLAMVPEDTAPNDQVVAEAPAVSAAEPTQATDESLAKAKKQAKEKPSEVTIETKVETPSPAPSSTGGEKSFGFGGTVRRERRAVDVRQVGRPVRKLPDVLLRRRRRLRRQADSQRRELRYEQAAPPLTSPCPSVRR